MPRNSVLQYQIEEFVEKRPTIIVLSSWSAAKIISLSHSPISMVIPPTVEMKKKAIKMDGEDGLIAFIKERPILTSPRKDEIHVKFWLTTKGSSTSDRPPIAKMQKGDRSSCLRRPVVKWLGCRLSTTESQKRPKRPRQARPEERLSRRRNPSRDKPRNHKPIPPQEEGLNEEPKKPFPPRERGKGQPLPDGLDLTNEQIADYINDVDYESLRLFYQNSSCPASLRSRAFFMYNKNMKKVLAFDVDQTLNIAKTPIPPEIADLLTQCLDHFEICPISGQKYDQFLFQIVDQLKDATPEQLEHLHLFVAQGTQYYRYDAAKKIGSKFIATHSPTTKSPKLPKPSKPPPKNSVTGRKISLPKATKSSKTASAKSPSLPSARKPAPKQSTLGTQIARSAKLSLLAPKSSPRLTTTKSVAPLPLTPSLLA